MGEGVTVQIAIVRPRAWMDGIVPITIRVDGIEAGKLKKGHRIGVLVTENSNYLLAASWGYGEVAVSLRGISDGDTFEVTQVHPPYFIWLILGASFAGVVWGPVPVGVIIGTFSAVALLAFFLYRFTNIIHLSLQKVEGSPPGWGVLG